jgi:pyruvate,water dikinase
MDPTVPLDIIASYVEQDLDRLDEVEHRARIDRDVATRLIRSKLASFPARLARFDAALFEARLWVRFIEDHNHYMEQCSIGTMREAVFDVGRVLVERNLIDDPDDVIHFTIAELRSVAADPHPADLRPRVRERAAELDRRRRMKPPQVLGKPPAESPSAPSETKAGLDGRRILGTAASGGRATGPAVLLLPGRPRPRLRPGDILVAPNVGPEWTPAFGVIAGLVLDSGSLSQHAAIVAREYRVPAVMQTKDASTSIVDGQTLTVDADAGVVYIDSSLP